MSTTNDSGNFVRYYIIDILRAAACVLIFHYHCNTFLPGEWKFLTLFGQDLGNNLFFMVSGFALYPSIAACDMRGIIPWYWRRLKRLLPMLVLAYAATYIAGFYSFGNAAQLFAVFIYPTLYWFASAILVFYLVLFLLAKLAPPVVRMMLCLLCLAGYQVFMDNQINLYLIGLASMIAGYMLRERLENKDTETAGNIGVRAWTPGLNKIGLLAGIIIYAIGKIIFALGQYAAIGHLIIGAGVLFMGLSALAWGYVGQGGLAGFFEDRRGFYSVIRYVGQMALPVYLVQCFLTGYIGYWIGLHINFPLSYPVNLIVIWGLASVLRLVDIKLTQR